VARDGAALSTAVRGADAGLAVPSCPDWDLAALVGHVGGVHGWVTTMLTTRATERASFPETPEGWDDRRVWFDEGLAALVDALGDVGPDEPVWNWADRAPAPARFWPRRMAHETAVHRWDAQHAAKPGHADPIDRALAEDGIDEYLGFVRMWLARRPVEGLGGTLELGVCTVDLAPDRIDVVPHPGQGDPSAALLFLTGRLPAGPGITGDVDAWQGAVRFS
jgi:uncharacterized protein (TIGR03083 family)